MSNYYNLTLADGISGDDVNRHLREKNLGFAPPSADWAESDKEIRCIWPGQVITRPSLNPRRGEYIHRYPAFWKPPFYKGDPLPIYAD